MKKLVQALNALADKLYASRDSAHRPSDKDIDHAAFGLSVLAHIVNGKSIERAFGAPGDWGYGTPIGDGVLAMIREPAVADNRIEWHFLPELPDADTTCLIAVEETDSDEVLLGYYDGDGGWWQQPGEVSLFVECTVYAWAHAPAKPAKKGGAS